MPPQPEVNAYWWRGRLLEQPQRWQDAVDAFSAALERAPSQDDPALRPMLEHRATAHIALSMYPSGLADLEAAIQMDSSSFRAQYLAALCLYNLGRHAEAVDAATRAIEIDASNGPAWFLRAAAKSTGGDASGALEDVQQAITLDPDDQQALTFKADLETYLRGQDH
jgi:tetratricopeptide (TPR) repeat protein